MLYRPAFVTNTIVDTGRYSILVCSEFSTLFVDLNKFELENNTPTFLIFVY